MNKCSFCDFQGADVIKHAVQQHSSHPSFFLVCDVCGGTWKRYDAFRKHVSRKHPHSQQALADLTCDDICGDLSEIHDKLSDDSTRGDILAHKLQEQSAAYILRLKSLHSLSQSCISDIIQQTNEIVRTATTFTREKILEQAKQIQSVREAFNNDDMNWTNVGDLLPFQGIETEWLQNKYFAEKFHLLQPMEVKMGERSVVKGSSVKQKPVF
jgi:hypothetical protein